eukprot:scaffold280046_cov35-Tisochrysis_lutea.AAC.1
MLGASLTDRCCCGHIGRSGRDDQHVRSLGRRTTSRLRHSGGGAGGLRGRGHTHRGGRRISFGEASGG